MSDKGGLWGRIEKVESGCWLFTGALIYSGYGQIGWRKKHWTAHRLAWTLARGPIPPGQHVLHRCDVRNCVNPDHLWLGTRADNIADMVAKKRHKGRAVRLSPARVQVIRYLGDNSSLTQEQIGALFGVSWKCVWSVNCRRSWRDVPEGLMSDD